LYQWLELELALRLQAAFAGMAVRKTSMLKSTDTRHLEPHSVAITRQFFRPELHFRAVCLIRCRSHSLLSNTAAKCHLFFLGLLFFQCTGKFNIFPTSFPKFCLIKVSHHSRTQYLLSSGVVAFVRPNFHTWPFYTDFRDCFGSYNLWVYTFTIIWYWT